MEIPNNKKIVCFTGSVWTGKHDAPRHMLIKHGYVRPKWFTTGRPLSDAHYYPISEVEYHKATAESRVLAHMKYGGIYTGILKNDFRDAVNAAKKGVLVVGFQEIVAQMAKMFPQIVIFAFKQQGIELSDHLNEAVRNRQVHRLNIDVLKDGAWNEVMENIQDVVGR